MYQPTINEPCEYMCNGKWIWLKPYFVCSRYKRKNGNLSCPGLHPEAWTEISEYINKT